MKTVIVTAGLALVVLTACGSHDGATRPSTATSGAVTSSTVTSPTEAPVTTPATTPAIVITAAPTSSDLASIQSDLAGASAANLQASGDLAAGESAAAASDNP